MHSVCMFVNYLVYIVIILRLRYLVIIFVMFLFVYYKADLLLNSSYCSL